ncbi:hypothetical protein RQP46_007321 [Phenoliferia psychrophenolica]
MTRNQSLIFNAVPSGLPKPGQDLKRIDGEIDLTAPLPVGGLLTKTIVLSQDPYQRGRMRPANTKSYTPPFELGKPLTNFGVSEVLESANPAFKKGDKVYGSHPFSEYATFTQEEAKGLKVLENKEKLPWSTWVGAAGMPGQTAWWGLLNVGQPKKGETIFVSGAAGAVGQMVIALSQQKGLKVVASAGSDDKVAFLKDTLKVDVAFNYKTTDTSSVLADHPLSIYWDNVGGPTLDAALAAMENRGRIIECGQISTYNGEAYGVKNTGLIVTKSLKMEGLIVLQHDISAFYDTIPGLIASGDIKQPKEHLTKGLDNGEAFVDLLTGGNFGKSVITFE